jgi:hypothetical protein
VGSRHQKQNREGGKAQSGQYMASWVRLLHYVNTPKKISIYIYIYIDRIDDSVFAADFLIGSDAILAVDF